MDIQDIARRFGTAATKLDEAMSEILAVKTGAPVPQGQEDELDDVVEGIRQLWLFATMAQQDTEAEAHAHHH